MFRIECTSDQGSPRISQHLPSAASDTTTPGTIVTAPHALLLVTRPYHRCAGLPAPPPSGQRCELLRRRACPSAGPLQIET